jgi:hypothetical protein
VNGCGRGKPDANFCVNCGTRLPVAAEKAARHDPVTVPAPAFLTKAAAPTARPVPQPPAGRDPLTLNQGAWRDEAFRDPDPTVREFAWQAHFDALMRGR